MRRIRGSRSTALGLALMVTWGCAQSQSARDDATHEEPMVSIGYGQVEQENVTGPIGVLTESELGGRTPTTVMEMIAGRVAGVRAVHTAYGTRLQIRGIHSLMGSTDPLFVVDGVPVTTDSFRALDFLNPHDVVRVEVLKGASAAVYGSRGANGVILITTRR